MRATEFVVEALTPEQTAKLFKDLGAKYDANIHDNVFKGKPRIYIPLPASTGAVIPQQSATQSEVQSAVQSLGYNIDNYQAGIASKKDDPNRKIRIGKLIKDQALLQQFANDKTRGAAKQQNLVVAISRDPVDIGGMSTDRGWTSCMDLQGGVNKKYVPTEIKNGAIIAYLISDDDRDINRPKARILLKPYYQDNHMILVPDQVYGTAPGSFPELVKKFATWANSGSPEGDYRLSKGSYLDDMHPDQYHVTSYDDIENASLNKKTTIASNENTPPEILAKLVRDKNTDVRYFLSKNTSTPPEALAKLALDRHGFIRGKVAQNTSTPPDSLAELARDKRQIVRYGAARNTSTPAEALVELARDQDQGIRFGVAQNTSTPPEVLADLVQDKDKVIRYGVATNTSTSPEDLSKLVLDKDREVRQAAKLTNKHARKGVLEGFKHPKTYLWHGSRNKIPVLEPRQAQDTGGAKGSNQTAIYATKDIKFAIAMGMTTQGSDTAMFPNDPQMVLFSGKIRKGQVVYLHKVPMYGSDGKPQFVPGANDREFYSVPGVKEIKPVEIKEVPVDRYLNLIRQATPEDLELQKYYSDPANQNKQDQTKDINQ